MSYSNVQHPTTLRKKEQQNVTPLMELCKMTCEWDKTECCTDFGASITKSELSLHLSFNTSITHYWEGQLTDKPTVADDTCKYIGLYSNFSKEN
jgi:hypothetical protein